MGQGKIFLTQFQVVIDCRDAARLVKFWSQALGYVPEPPPKGFSSWKEFYKKIGIPEEELTEETDSIVDPDRKGPRIWFHVVPESKICKNRLHFDLGVSGWFVWDSNEHSKNLEPST